ncbi:hypothetical protein [uncultured Bilophila sp.]|uniref:hypothetical protein n=1 Tax=uncultured Bilophila sp. TaxID=529385 RepID=UPI0026DC728D|nr:hypothetical protein [uncultured Bilophila sp.]
MGIARHTTARTEARRSPSRGPARRRPDTLDPSRKAAPFGRGRIPADTLSACGVPAVPGEAAGTALIRYAARLDDGPRPPPAGGGVWDQARFKALLVPPPPAGGGVLKTIKGTEANIPPLARRGRRKHAENPFRQSSLTIPPCR